MHYGNPYIEICVEGSSSIFKGLNQKDKELIDQHHIVSIYGKGELIISEGDKPKGIMCLASGKVKTFRVGVGGREQILNMVRQNGFLCYRVLFSDNPQPFSAMALEDSAVVIFEKNCLLKILKRNAELTFKFMKVMSEDLLFINNRLVSLTQKHVRGRIAETLLILRDTYGLEADGKTIRVMLPREDIAHLSNMTTSNAIRTLSNLSSERVIEMDKRRIKILDSNRLEHISELG
jgi:CRP-like cAMP-binding protein